MKKLKNFWKKIPSKKLSFLEDFGVIQKKETINFHLPKIRKIF